MKRMLLSLVLGCFLGGFGMYILSPKSPTGSSQKKSIGAILEQVEKSDQVEAGVAESPDRFAMYKTIDDILKLRSDFQQTEALYVLAGRASPRRLIDLVKQAEEVADASDRGYALGILFARLTEVSPDLALEAASDVRFAADENIIRAIWRTWARLDFDAALAAAKELSPQNRKEAAVNAMYWALGVFGNQKTNQIMAVTGIEPSLWAVSQTIEKMAKNSISEAIDTVNQLSRLNHQTYVARDLAIFAAKSRPDSALSYVDLFNSLPASKIYRATVLKTVAEQSPETVLQTWRASGGVEGATDAVFSALAQLAYEDFDQATAYAEETVDANVKTRMLKVILAVKVRENPDEAMVLAQQYQEQGIKGMLAYTVQRILSVSPSDALLALESMPKTPEINRLMAKAIGRLSESDPNAAIAKIQTLEDPALRAKATAQLVTAWSRSDVDSALRYALTLDELQVSQNSIGIDLQSANLDLAMQFLEKFDQSSVGSSVYGFANSLLERHGMEELISLLRPYDKNESFANMKTVLLNQVSNKSIDDAERFIDEFWRDEDKSDAYVNLAHSAIYQRPEQVLSLLDKVDNESDKVAMVSNIMGIWAHKDKANARAWVQGLPNGRVRDNAIVAYSHQLEPDSNGDTRLINSIENTVLREEAVIGMLFDKIEEGPDKINRWGSRFNLSQQSMSYLSSIADCYKVDANQPELLRKCRSLFSSRL